jgi:predicted nucleotidyltransferase
VLYRSRSACSHGLASTRWARRGCAQRASREAGPLVHARQPEALAARPGVETDTVVRYSPEAARRRVRSGRRGIQHARSVGRSPSSIEELLERVDP